jgi:hypothetical protein
VNRRLRTIRKLKCILSPIWVLIAILGLFLLASCNSSIRSVNSGGTYLGQNPPGPTPEIFAPGIVSDPEFFEYSGTFSPDGKEYYFYRFSNNSPSQLLFTKLVEGKWTSPEICEFTGEYAASEPHLTFGNNTLYFMWDYPWKPGQSGYQEQTEYFFVERTADGWSEPVDAGQGMFLSSDRAGEIYTTDMSSRARTGLTYLAKVTTNDGVFTDYEILNIQPRFGYQAHPCIAPDGSYILFDVAGGNYLYVSFKKADGTWGEAIDLTKHGFNAQAGGAYISPDGKYLFFSLNGDIWWVDIKVIESLRPK